MNNAKKTERIIAIALVISLLFLALGVGIRFINNQKEEKSQMPIN